MIDFWHFDGTPDELWTTVAAQPEIPHPIRDYAERVLAPESSYFFTRGTPDALTGLSEKTVSREIDQRRIQALDESLKIIREHSEYPPCVSLVFALAKASLISDNHNVRVAALWCFPLVLTEAPHKALHVFSAIHQRIESRADQPVSVQEALGGVLKFTGIAYGWFRRRKKLLYPEARHTLPGDRVIYSTPPLSTRPAPYNPLVPP